MSEIIRLDTIGDYGRDLGVEIRSPLVSVIDFSRLESIRHGKRNYGFYAVFYKELSCGDLSYGRSRYDYQEGTFVFVGPGQVVGVDDGGVTLHPKGRVLVFQPDLIYGTSLARRIREYSFFRYDSTEALHVSEGERGVILDGFDAVAREIARGGERIDRRVVAGLIGTMLDHCKDFYDRQFATREQPNRDLLSQFERLLIDYFQSDKPQKIGLPTVKYCADELCLSPNYFGDLIRKETGMTAQEYIQRTVVDRVKSSLSLGGETVGQIAFRLGFRYPHHLSRMFKKVTGVTPKEYRAGVKR